jgi:large subunit ribosomal protein L23
MKAKDPRDIVKSVELTEKGNRLTDSENKYFFTVDGSANKVEIKKAVEALFKVSVMRVNTMNYMGKPKRERTAQFGRTAKWKRAVVTLKEGDKIEFV